MGGDRPVYSQYDHLKIAYKYYPQYFKRFAADEEISQCRNEMEVMNLIASTIKLPDTFKDIPVISVFTQKKSMEKIQSSTSDTIVELLKHHNLSMQLPILFLGTLPYIVRQGMQAQQLMPNHQIDIGSIFEPYLETIDTPLKGELPSALYLDELHWFLCNQKPD